MPSAEELAQQRRLLEKHRRNLNRLEEQAASFGGEMTTPLYILNGLDETREAIRRIEDDMQAGKVPRSEAISTDRNRTAMLAKVKAIWVDGLLKDSLEHEVGIALDLVEQSEAVHLPLNTIVQELSRPPRPLPTATPIIEVFDASNGTLLILGAPGAGKTTLLLELTRDLITRAEYDVTHPIPVVFNLSSWAEKRQPLTTWLVEELNVRYDVPRKVGNAWVREDALLPLLDGLDEVQQEHRTACVEAINVYRGEHGLVPVAVCSRLADYDTLAVKLRLQDAVVVQPLTQGQIASFLDRVGPSLAGLKTVLDQDATLRELAETPLMLAIMTLAYRDVPIERLGVSSSLEHQRKRLFDAYLQRMFARRGASPHYTREATARWLGWLARGMQQHGQSIFLVERLQPEWLTQQAQRQYVLADRLGLGLVVGLAYALVALFLSGIPIWLIIRPNDWGDTLFLMGRIGLSETLFGWTLAGLFGGAAAGALRERLPWTHIATNVLSGWLVLGLVGSLGNMLVEGINELLRVGPLLVLSLGLGAGLIGGMAGLLTGKPGLGSRSIALVEQMRWSWRRAWPLGLLLGLVPGVLLLALVWLAVGLSDSSSEDLSLGRAIALATGLSVWHIVVFVSGLDHRIVSASSRPNEGIRRSTRSAIRNGLVGWVVVWVGGEVSEGLALGLRAVLNSGLTSGLTSGLVVGLAFGGYAVLSHLALRVVLWRHGAMPLNYVRFLDYCVERIFLRRVGGGYIFVHRMLLEYFASLNTSQTPSETPTKP